VFPQAVVNSRLQVKGIEGLRVVDASIMPTTGNNHLSCFYQWSHFLLFPHDELLKLHLG
jgi:hypothetical protein